MLRRAQIDGRAGTDDHFQIKIAPAGPRAADGRQLMARASDAGALLRALDLISSMQGGALAMTGRYDDSRADHPLSGTAEMTEFRLGDAPVAARVLKAMTLMVVLHEFPDHRLELADMAARAGFLVQQFQRNLPFVLLTTMFARNSYMRRSVGFRSRK